MSADNAQREPTMEEILASIRRIISEDDKPMEEGGDVLELQPAPVPPVMETKTPPPAPQPAPAAAAPKPAPRDAIFEEPPESADDLILVEAEEDFDSDDLSFEEPAAPAAVAPSPVFRPEPRAARMDDGLVGEPAAAMAAGALNKLLGSMVVNTGNTLDDIVREMLKPMLKAWLDENLPAIVEAEVAREIERIRRMAR
jgi:cell pole-organizing protein PopZ